MQNARYTQFQDTQSLFKNARFVCPLWSKGQSKAIPVQAWTEGSRRWRLPDVKTSGIWRW